jgi:tetratricopeptide (TPR) repeat protein
MRFFHFRNDKWIFGYLWNQLSPAARQAFEKHIEGCKDCRARLEKERELETLLQETGQNLAPTQESLENLKAKIGPLKPYEYVEITEEVEKKSVSLQYVFKTAAAMAVIALVSFCIWMGLPKVEPVTVDKLVGRGLQVIPAGESKPKVFVLGDRIRKGDIIMTAPNTRAALKFGNMGTLWIQQGTQLAFLGQDSADFSVDSGEVWVEVSRHGTPFHVQTPMGKVSVLGTEFRVIVKEGYLTVACIKSRVQLENQYGNVTINQGWKSYAKPDSAPKEPVKLSGNTDWRNLVDYYGKKTPEEQQLSYFQLMKLAQEKYNNKEYEKAWNYYAWATVLEPESQKAWIGMGDCSADLRLVKRACKEFLWAYQINPDKFAENWNCGCVLLDSGDYEMAQMMMQRMIKNRPDYHGGWLMLGEVNMAQGRYEEARYNLSKSWMTGVKDCPACAERYWIDMAYMAYLNGDMSAMDAYKKQWAVDFNPRAYGWALTARIYRKQGSIQGERNAWWHYLHNVPDGPFAKEAHQRLDILEKL